MSEELTNRIRAEIDRYMRARAEPRNATITAYDPATYSVKVKIQPEASDPSAGETPASGWIKLHSQYVGNGWGLMFGPTIGTQVSLRFQENDPGSPSVEGAFFDNNNAVPASGGPPSGEGWLVDSNDQYIKLLKTGPKMVLNSSTEIDIGNVEDTLHELVHQAFQALFNDHTHGGGAVPDQQMTSAQLTAILKAN